MLRGRAGDAGFVGRALDAFIRRRKCAFQSPLTPAKTPPSLVVAVWTEWPRVLELHSRRIISRFAGQTSAADVAGRGDWIGCSSAGTGREQKWTTSNRRQDKH